MSNLTPKVGATAVSIDTTITDGSTGQTVLLVIRRTADDFYLDFNDNVFKASGHTTRQLTMTEVSASDSQGVYRFIWNPSTPVTTPGAYLAEKEVTISGTLHKTQDYINFIADKDDEIDAIKAKTDNLPADPASETNVDANETKIDLLQVDSTAILADTSEMQDKLPTNNIMGSGVKTDKNDEIDAIKLSTDNLPSDPTSETNATLNKDEIIAEIDSNEADIARILGLNQENFFLDNTVYNSVGILTSGRMRIFPDNTFTATDGGTGEGETDTYIVAVTTESGRPDLVKSYQVKRS